MSDVPREILLALRHRCQAANAAGDDDKCAQAVAETDRVLATIANRTEGAPIRLVWHQRPDGLWNAICACHATIAGWIFDRRAEAEVGHFEIAAKERARRAGTPRQNPDCGAKLLQLDPNYPEPPVFL